MIKVTFEPEVRFNSQKDPFSMSPSDILSLICLALDATNKALLNWSRAILFQSLCWVNPITLSQDPSFH